MYTRRKFLISSASWLGGLAIRPLKGLDPDVDEGKIGRVTTKSISVYSKPSDKSKVPDTSVSEMSWSTSMMRSFLKMAQIITRNGTGSGAVTFTAHTCNKSSFVTIR